MKLEAVFDKINSYKTNLKHLRNSYAQASLDSYNDAQKARDNSKQSDADFYFEQAGEKQKIAQVLNDELYTVEKLLEELKNLIEPTE